MQSMLKTNLKLMAEFCWLVLQQVSAWITGGIIAAGVFLYEHYRQQSIDMVVVYYGLLAFFVIGCFLAWKEERAKSPSRVFLKESDIGKFEEMRKKADQLLEEAKSTNVVRSDWRSRAMAWNESMEEIIEGTLPMSELWSYQSVNTAPTNDGPPFLNTWNYLNGRRNKLRNMMKRLMPPAWDKPKA